MAKIIIPDSYRKWDSEDVAMEASAPGQLMEESAPAQNAEEIQKKSEMVESLKTEDPISYMLELFHNNRETEGFAFGEELAKKGDVVAMAMLCAQYMGLPEYEDYGKAVYWGTRAAQHPNFRTELDIEAYASVYAMLSDCYINGKGVEKDMKLGVKYLKQSAELENTEGMRVLGWLYYDGNGVIQDYNEAFYWFQKGALAGDCYAQERMGCLYENGEGVDADLEEAIRWYRMAFRNGAEDAEGPLALLLLERKFLVESDEEMEWLEAWRQGFADRLMKQMGLK